jgi:archaellum biogenesis ATPase FlaH
MELPLLAASLRSRQDFDLIKSYIDMRASTYSKRFQIVMKKVGEYYQRDANAGSVDHTILLAQIAESIRNDKHVQQFTELVAESLATNGSDVNVRAVILLAKQQEVGDKLAQALAMDSTQPRVDALLDELKELRTMTSLDELAEEGLEVFHDIDLEDLIVREFNPELLIKVYPESLNAKLDGGVKKENHIIAFGPVEIGKSLLTINASCGFARQEKKGLYFINEDRPQSIIMRMVSNLSGWNKHQIMQNPHRAMELANENGFRNITVVSCAPGTPQQVEDHIDQYEPEWIVADQLRNFKVKAENRTNQLEMAATAFRTIGKKKNVLVWSVTQGADSCRNKLQMDTGDVDSSNVGIPAQADVLLGIGADEAMLVENTRMLSLPKNKISGNHDFWPIRVNPQLSRAISV